MPNNMPYMQFYVDDFDNDTCGLSSSAVGVWLRILLAMHRKKSGQITGSIDKLSKITRCSVDELNSALTEFENDSVCEILRESNGAVTIICRRLFREEQKRNNSAERVRRFREKKASEQIDETETKPCGNAQETLYARALYPNPYPKPELINTTVFAFDEFWNAYGKKVERAKCEKLYAKISEKDREKIKAHVPKYVAATPDVQYRKNPQTYINGKCWEDEIITNNYNRAENHGGNFSQEEIKNGDDRFF